MLAKMGRERFTKGLLFGLSAAGLIGCSKSPQNWSAPANDGAAVRQEAWVSNSGETTLSVIDDATKTVVDTIQLGVPDDAGVLRGVAHGIAVARTKHTAYAGTEDTGEVIALDTLTRKIAWRLHAGNNFQLGTLTMDDRYLFMPDLGAGRVVVIDTEAKQVDGEIAMIDPSDAAAGALSGLHNMYTSADGAHVYVTAIFSQKVAKISASTRQIERIYDIDGQPRPAVFSATSNTMYLQLSALQGFIAFDLSTGKETQRISIPDDGLRPPGWDNWTFSHGLYLSRDESELWTDSVVAGKVYVYSLPGYQQASVIDVGIMPRWFAATADESTLYVTNTTPASDHGTVTIIDRRSRTVIATVDVGKAPKDVHMVSVPR